MKKCAWEAKKLTKLSNLAEQAGPEKIPFFLTVGLVFFVMFLASTPSADLNCLRERERRALWGPAPQQRPGLHALNSVSPWASDRWVASLPSPMSCWVSSPKCLHSMSAQSLTPCWGGSSRRSHISQYDYQRCPVSAAGLARHRRVCSLTVMEVFGLGLYLHVCWTWSEGEVSKRRCSHPILDLIEEVFKWPDWNSQIKIAFNFGESLVQGPISS